MDSKNSMINSHILTSGLNIDVLIFKHFVKFLNVVGLLCIYITNIKIRHNNIIKKLSIIFVSI